MVKLLIPIVLALLGLGAGVGAGLALKPAPPPMPEKSENEACLEEKAAEPEEGAAAIDGVEGGKDPCLETAALDPYAPEAAGGEEEGDGEPPVFVPLEKPFVVPVFHGDKVAAMVVASLSIATEGEASQVVNAVEPRLRDRFLEVLFMHANSGGFDGSFTTGRKIMDLKTALLSAAREVMGDVPVSEVLITEINRQDT